LNSSTWDIGSGNRRAIARENESANWSKRGILESNDRLKESLHDSGKINKEEEIINRFGVVADNHATLGSISPQLSNLTMKALL